MLLNLKLLRAQAKVSQRALADAIGASQQSINKYENHNIEPDIDTMIKIADFFETSVDYLIGHTDVQRRIEKLDEHQLNAEESRLLSSYRQLSPKQRKCVLLMMESYNDKL